MKALRILAILATLLMLFVVPTNAEESEIAVEGNLTAQIIDARKKQVRFSGDFSGEVYSARLYIDGEFIAAYPETDLESPFEYTVTCQERDWCTARLFVYGYTPDDQVIAVAGVDLSPPYQDPPKGR